MRVAFVADIHANLPALEAVQRDIDRVGVDEELCLGDVLGYGAFPNECAEFVRERGVRCLAGNHDLAILEWLDSSSYHPDALTAIQWQRAELAAVNRAWVSRFESSASLDGFDAMHGVPPRPLDFEYLLGLEGAARMVHRFPMLARTTFIGHSHLTKTFVVRRDRAFEVSASEIRLPDEARTIVTVGSVGQPRDRNPAASWVLFDTAARLVRYRRVEYDVRTAARAIRERGLPPFLADRLFYGI
jgi:diadenosine tetraphosphatase ApaH/serine/threonine PP2A family protein phosphatase